MVLAGVRALGYVAGRRANSALTRSRMWGPFACTWWRAVWPGSVNGAMVGLRFFFRVTLGRPEALDYIPMAREPQRLPTVLSAQEVARLLEAAPG